MLPAILLSGFIFPIRIMPALLQAITYLVPARYYLVILRGIILKGEGLATLLARSGALADLRLAAVTLASLAPRAPGGLSAMYVLWRVIVKELLQLRHDGA